MAEETLGKTVNKLKKERTYAKSSFTKQTNFLCREAHRLLESELTEEFKNSPLKQGKFLKQMMITRLGYWKKLEKTVQKHCFQYSKKLILGKLWRNVTQGLRKLMSQCKLISGKKYGQTEVIAAVSAAEKACEHTATVPVDAIGLWTPTTERAELEGHVRKMKEFSNELEARKVVFAWAR